MSTFFPYLLRGRNCRFCPGMDKVFAFTIAVIGIRPVKLLVIFLKIGMWFVSRKFTAIRQIFSTLSPNGYLGGKFVCLRFVISRDLSLLPLEVLSLPFVLNCLDCAFLKRE